MKKTQKELEAIVFPAKYKQIARTKIRAIKDYEDDLTDLKQVVQFMARGFAGIWYSLPKEVKAANPYKDNFDIFVAKIMDARMRIDLETDQVVRIGKVLADEIIFADIVDREYLGKLKE